MSYGFIELPFKLEIYTLNTHVNEMILLRFLGVINKTFYARFSHNMKLEIPIKYYHNYKLYIVQSFDSSWIHLTRY